MKKYVFLDTNIWLILYSNNRKAIEQILKLLDDQTNTIVVHSIVEMELLRNKNKIIKRCKLSPFVKKSRDEFINKYITNNKNLVRISEWIKFIDETEKRKYIHIPPYFSSSGKALSNNDTLMWLSLIDYFKGKKGNITIYSNDTDFFESREYLAKEWLEKTNMPITIDRIDMFADFKTILTQTNSDFEECKEIFSYLNELLSIGEIADSFKQTLIEITSYDCPVRTLLIDYFNDPRNKVVTEFYFNLMCDINKNYAYDTTIKSKRAKKQWEKIQSLFSPQKTNRN